MRFILDFFGNQCFVSNRGVSSTAAEPMLLIAEQRNAETTKSTGKKRSSRRSLLIVTLLLTISLPIANAATHHHATSTTSHKEKLRVINQQITLTKAQLDKSEQQRNDLEKQLETIEKTIGNIAINMGQLDKQIANESISLQPLTAQEKAYQQQLLVQHTALAEQLRSAYENHQENFLQVLLNQQDPSKISLMMMYYRYFNEARLQLIANVNMTLEKLKITETNIQSHMQTLQLYRQQQQTATTQLRQQEQQRKVILDQLNHTIQTNQQRLQILLNDRSRLEHVISGLSSSEFINLAGKPFSRLQGKLPWPTKGHISTTFGSHTGQQSLAYQGVFIAAPIGQNIQAIATGKVVFANWLNGLGLLLIIDHGNGYMSLYAHCYSILKAVGSMIQPGEVVATVGNSGGQMNSGVMFEIRHNTQPQNPQHWCKGRP